MPVRATSRSLAVDPQGSSLSDYATLPDNGLAGVTWERQGDSTGATFTSGFPLTFSGLGSISRGGGEGEMGTTGRTCTHCKAALVQFAGVLVCARGDCTYGLTVPVPSVRNATISLAQRIGFKVAKRA